MRRRMARYSFAQYEGTLHVTTLSQRVLVEDVGGTLHVAGGVQRRLHLERVAERFQHRAK